MESEPSHRFIYNLLTRWKNHDAFHGRTPFKFHPGGDNRWLLRTFITRDLSRSSADRPDDGRIVDANYAAGRNVMMVG